MRGILIIFGVALYVIAMPFIFNGIHTARTDQFDQNFAEITTAAAATSANITLSRALWGSDAANVVNVSSNFTGDSPSANAYNSVSRILTVGGLASSQTRTLAVTYEIASTTLAELPSVSPLLIVLVVFIILATIGLAGGALWAVIQEFR